MTNHDEQLPPAEVHQKRPLGVQKRRAFRLVVIIALLFAAFIVAIAIAWRMTA